MQWIYLFFCMLFRQWSFCKRFKNATNTFQGFFNVFVNWLRHSVDEIVSPSCQNLWPFLCINKSLNIPLHTTFAVSSIATATALKILLAFQGSLLGCIIQSTNDQINPIGHKRANSTTAERNNKKLTIISQIKNINTAL